MELKILTREEPARIEAIGKMWEPDDFSLFEDTARELLDGAVDSLVLDINRLTFVSSPALGALIRTFGWSKDRNKRFVLFNPNDDIRDFLETAGVHRVIPVLSTEDELQARIDASGAAPS